jgi:acetoin utilization deacetylase AcuC-like enzyme
MKDLVFFYPFGHQAHSKAGFIERPERIEVIWSALQKESWWGQVEQVGAAPVPVSILESVHKPAYLNLLEMACRRSSLLDGDTYTTPQSWKLALQAAGGGIAVAQAVWNREARRGFALCRPPGHHAMRGQGMGFCLLNNVALAAEALIQNQGARKLAIIDLDLHHGNGTQDIFWARPDVFYISTHLSPYYPGSGSLAEQGGGKGFGFTANFPLPPESGDAAFEMIMKELILPLLDRYSPEMLLVSFGFDTHWLDPLGWLQLSADGMARLIHSLAAWSDAHCQGRLAIFLEGGYHLDAAEVCTTAVIRAMLGLEWEDSLGKSPSPETERWKEMVSKAKEIWGT